jgi:hypothetical protein
MVVTYITHTFTCRSLESLRIKVKEIIDELVSKSFSKFPSFLTGSPGQIFKVTHFQNYFQPKSSQFQELPLRVEKLIIKTNIASSL